MADTSMDQTASHGLGAIPALAVLTAYGLAAVAVADALSRTGHAQVEPVLWVGLGLIFLPTFARLTSLSPSRAERVTLVLLLGLALYIVKVMRDPFGFTYADELVHQYNVIDILRSHSLFGHNPILTVTPSYPGLEGTTAALSSLTGLSSFSSGLLVVGAARTLMMLGLFLLFEAAADSARLAAVAVALYASTPNFLFFNADFSYESLALPLAVFAAVAGVYWWRSEHEGRAWLEVAVLAVAAVTVTHHLTSYALAAFFAVVGLVSCSPRRSGFRMLILAVLSTAMAVSWLFIVASVTVGYLTPVITRAVSATAGTVAHERAARTLFTSAAGQVAPVWDRLVGLGSAVLVALAQPVGLPVVWRRYRGSAVALAFGMASVAYVASLGLRLVPAAWETGSRASEFLFIGGSFVVGLAMLHVIDHVRSSAAVRAGVWVAAVVIFAGGVISGSAYGFRAAQPYEVAVSGATIVPPGVAAARWIGSALHQSEPIAAEQADARLVLVYGDQNVVAGMNPDVQDVLHTPRFYRWQVQLLRRLKVRYVMVDARMASANVSTGYFFPTGSVASEERYPMAVVTKFERAGAMRVFDSGDVVIDDLSTVNQRAATP
jgi:hypothetical protein